MRLVVYVDHFPALSETFVVEDVAALRRAGHDVRVETAGWAAERAQLEDPPPTDCQDDDSHARRLLDLGWLVARNPRAVLADLRARRHWAAEEDVRPLRVLAPAARRLVRNGERHLHVHFAGPAALDALRLTRLVGVQYSVVAHAYEIYRRPANLAAKLRNAKIAAGVCAATVRDLRAVAGPAHAGQVHELAMGTDADRFTRRTAPAGQRRVLAVGRLVEKKGFVHLVAAAALLRDRGVPLDRVTIVGDGPERGELARAIADAGLQDVVQLAGSRQPAEVAGFLEDADVLAVPSVIARDGDRDALPVVVGEALAMEVPVVGSDLVGLPDVVRAPWGVLVAPGDPAALADALDGILARPAAERAEIGRAARDWVREERSPDRSAARLVDLIR